MKKNKKQYFVAVDIGNSMVSIGLFDRFKLVQREALPALSVSRKKVLSVLRKWMKNRLSSLREAVISSVNKPRQASVISAFRETGIKAFSLKEVADKAIFRKYSSFSKLGEDRIANIYYCLHFLRCPSVVFDIGTALNVDVFDGRHYAGGYIISGPEMERDALQAKARGTRLKKKILFIPSLHRPGLCTAECIQRGILISKESFVEGCVKAVKSSLQKRSVAVVLTGGNWRILKDLAIFDIVDIGVTLKGLVAALILKKFSMQG